jgi:type I restriction enzyme S subunit
MSKRGQYELQSRATGTTVQGIKRTEFAKVKIKLPPLPEQKALAHILGSLDDKIALNRQTNATLEAMVQALFRSWFVDFDPVLDNAWRAGNAIPEALQAKAATRQQILAQADAPRLPQAVLDLFPSSFVFNEALNQWVPEGWEVKPLGVVTKQVFSGGTPNTQEKSYWNGMFNWFSSGETRNNYIIKTEKSITKLGVDNSSTKLALSGDILIASAGQGHTRGQTSYCAISTYVNQSVVVIRPQKNNSIWLYQNLKGRYDEMRMISDSHSIRGSLTSKLIKNLNLIMPKPKLIHYFENRCLANTEKIIENSKQTQTLTQLRDTLLPQLISGRVRVPEGLG